MIEIYSKIEFNIKDDNNKKSENSDIQLPFAIENPYKYRLRLNSDIKTNEVGETSYNNELSNFSKIVNMQEFYSIKHNANSQKLDVIETPQKNNNLEFFIEEIMLESNEPNKPKLFLVNWPRKMTASGCKISCKISCDCIKHNSNTHVKEEERKLRSTNSAYLTQVNVLEIENGVKKNLTNYFENTKASNYYDDKNLSNQNNKYSYEAILLEKDESNENKNILNTKSSSDETEVIKYYPYSRSRAFTYNKQDYRASKRHFVDYDCEKRRKSYINPSETLFYSSYKGVGYSSYNYGSYYPYNSSKFKRGLW